VTHDHVSPVPPKLAPGEGTEGGKDPESGEAASKKADRQGFQLEAMTQVEGGGQYTLSPL